MLMRGGKPYDTFVFSRTPVIVLDHLSDFYQDSARTTPATATDPVGSWSDRSGNGFHASASGASRPTLSTLGGEAALLWDGADDLMTIANDAAFADLEAWTIFAHLQASGPGELNVPRIWQYNGEQYYARLNASYTSTVVIDGSTGDATTTTTTTLTVDTQESLFYTLDAAGDKKAHIYWSEAGALVAEMAYSANTAFTGNLVKPSVDLLLGNLAGLNTTFDGFMKAFIIFPKVLSLSEMQMLTGFF